MAGFTITLLAARLIAGEKTFSEMPLLRVILQWVLNVSAVHIIGCFILALLTRKENKDWWERTNDRRKKNSGGNFADLYFKGLILSMPLIVYGFLAYAAFFRSWKTLAGLACAYIVIGTILYFQRGRANSGGASQPSTSGTVN